ncbi:hypothetical protein QQS21_012225 [Conoideocrella luteorostrata]|uniref:Uncharacterized protein n=1 Tax=Conoideocrella luteorostrata TaxID=1105319 RepID=A0AAJ0CBX6_9HYPO|nr:hypothetical protein QQS21_012225 [Conoideocrella luteorostrata]
MRSPSPKIQSDTSDQKDSPCINEVNHFRNDHSFRSTGSDNISRDLGHQQASAPDGQQHQTLSRHRLKNISSSCMPRNSSFAAGLGYNQRRSTELTNSGKFPLEARRTSNSPTSSEVEDEEEEKEKEKEKEKEEKEKDEDKDEDKDENENEDGNKYAHDEKTMATWGSPRSRRPPSTDSQAVGDDVLSLSQDLPSDVDSQELLDFLHEFEDERRDHNRTKAGNAVTQRVHDSHDKSALLSQHPNNEMKQMELQGINRQDAQSPQLIKSDSVASDTAQHPPSSLSYLHLDLAAASPSPIDDLGRTRHHEPLGQAPYVSAEDSSMVSLAVGPPGSPPELRYRQPQLFIGRLASSKDLPPSQMRAAQKTKKSNRPDIRALPNYDPNCDEDPIEDA